jgi:predicted transglutaminase-like cysteine proteinase
MFSRFFKTSIFVLALMATSAGVTEQAEGHGNKPRFLVIGNQTSLPYGWIDFCGRYKNECDGALTQPSEIELNPTHIKMIEQINQSVNTSITPMSDMDHWGVVDQWDYSVDGFGDCEDYALLKRKMLISAGFPRSALLITVVRDHEGEGHAILTVHSNRGDLILDNLSDDVKFWYETGYNFVKRQDARNQNAWVELLDPNGVVAMVSR